MPPQVPWRWISCLAADGLTQMAIDRYLLDQHLYHQHPPTLRFYTWQPIALSLGYHQRSYPEHWQDLTWQGNPIPLIRRPTGGRAVLHQGDLTYAVIASGFSRHRMTSYQQISEFLIVGMRSLGIELAYGRAGRGYIHNPNCFGTATGADLVRSDGSKLIGSAQLHHHGAILQHGSIQLQPDRELFEQVFGDFPFASIVPMQPLDPIDIVSALVNAAQAVFNAKLELQELSDREWIEIKTKYAHSP
jgi:lipoate---protein ligase